MLAAGRGLRFGGAKLLARLDGRPVVQHVLDTAAEVGLQPAVVVLGGDARQLESAVDWRSEIRAVNPRPERGLATSLQVGLQALERAAPEASRVLVLLADQPRLLPAQIGVILAVPSDARRPIVVPRYQDGRAGNPVLLERPAWDLAAGLSGDRGMSQLFDSRPELIRLVDVPGTNPDVDTREDLASLG